MTGQGEHQAGGQVPGAGQSPGSGLPGGVLGEQAALAGAAGQAPFAPAFERPEEYAPAREQAEPDVRQQIRTVLSEAREQLDAAAVIVTEMRESADGFSLRIAAMGERLGELDSSLEATATSSATWAETAAARQAAAQTAAGPPAHTAAGASTGFAEPPAGAPVAPAGEPAPVGSGAPVGADAAHVPTGAVAAPGGAPAHYGAQEVDAPISTRTISLSVASLSNLTVVSVVEAALLRIPGVREVALRQLQGREAILDVRLDEGTGLISGLRKSLPLAFDVTESSDHNLGISLSYAEANPETANGGGVG